MIIRTNGDFTSKGHAMPDNHDAWVARAREVAGTLAADALERDRADAEPTAEASLLKDAGLPGLLIPESLGGAGQTWRTALAVVREIARADGSIAQLIGYHYVNSSNLWLVGNEAIQKRLGGLTARHQWLWGDAVNPVEPDLALTPAGAGYRLDGKKTFATGASVGDMIAVTGEVAGTGDLVLAAVPANADGVTFGKDWDNLGQRLSASGSVTFSGTPVPAEDVIGPLSAPTPLASAITPAIQAVFGHLYLGIAEGALDAARNYTVTRSRPWVLGGQQAATDEPHVLAQYGDHAARLAAVAALANEIACDLAAALAKGHALTWTERGELAVEVAKLKVVSTDTALDVTSKIFEVTGARSTDNRYGFDRFWRNVRTHTLHDPVAYKRREVGAYYLTGQLPDFTLYT
jgi:alkylation response protein AidB-like acyl-CoA dehydrogenase